MQKDDKPKVLRLPKRHEPGSHRRPTPADGERIVRAQSLRDAFMAASIAIILFAILWAMVSVAFDRVLPWFTLLLGLAIGLVVRRAGQGIDWRFPMLAALMGIVGSVFSNVVVAAANTAGAFNMSTLQVLRNVTSYTWPMFFEEVMTPADFVFALFAAGIAAAYANRRLNRAQFHAVRVYEESLGEQA